MKFTPIIGMEIHVELSTKSKMFCSCANNPDEKEPNRNVCPICLAQPGTLPVPNKKAIQLTVRAAKALGCKIREISKFDRKHYFYPDLPKGYQISQYDEPIGENGSIELIFPLGDNVRDEAHIGITRVHLEEDTAKLLHDKEGQTLINFNRAGAPLMEIVTDPDFKTALEAKTYCQELRAILRLLEVSTADMEKGQMRCEVNISMQKTGGFEIVNGQVKALSGNTLNSKAEIKNINSFRAVEKAIEFEIKRQTELLEKGEKILQETRGWDDNISETVSQRIKENTADYRYFPEPDIPPFLPLEIAGNFSIPELPIAKSRRFHEEYGFSYADSRTLSLDADWSEFTESAMSELIEWLHSLPETSDESDEIRENKKNKIARLMSGWITTKLFGALATRNLTARDLKITPENFAELIALIYAERINSTNAQKILEIMIDRGTDVDPTHVMEEYKFGQQRDSRALEEIADQIIKNFPEQVAQFRAGKEPLIKFLLGMAMKASEGSADPKLMEEILRKKISG